VHVVHLELQRVDLDLVLLDLVFHGELLGEDGARLVVQLLGNRGQSVLVHGAEVGHFANLFFDSVGDGHDAGRVCGALILLRWHML